MSHGADSVKSIIFALCANLAIAVSTVWVTLAAAPIATPSEADCVRPNINMDQRQRARTKEEIDFRGVNYLCQRVVAPADVECARIAGLGVGDRYRTGGR